VQKYINPEYMGQDGRFCFTSLKNTSIVVTTDFFTTQYREFMNKRAIALMAKPDRKTRCKYGNGG
jgi:hypothetical protein